MQLTKLLDRSLLSYCRAWPLRSFTQTVLLFNKVASTIGLTSITSLLLFSFFDKLQLLLLLHIVLNTLRKMLETTTKPVPPLSVLTSWTCAGCASPELGWAWSQRGAALAEARASTPRSAFGPCTSHTSPTPLHSGSPSPRNRPGTPMCMMGTPAATIPQPGTANTHLSKFQFSEPVVNILMQVFRIETLHLSELSANSTFLSEIQEPKSSSKWKLIILYCSPRYFEGLEGHCIGHLGKWHGVTKIDTT